MNNQAPVIEIGKRAVENVNSLETEAQVISGELPFHPVAEIFPLMTGQAFEDLKTDILEHGLREPIWLHDGQIVDGRNRYIACQEVGIPAMAREWSGNEDLVGFVVSLNLHRRHLTNTQRAMVAVKIANLKLGGGFYSSKVKNGSSGEEPFLPISQKDAAKLMNVSHMSVQRAAAIKKKDVPELTEAVFNGEIALNTGYTIANKLSEKEVRAAVAGGKEGIEEAARRTREQRKQNQKEVKSKESKPEPQKKGKVVPIKKDIFGEPIYDESLMDEDFREAWEALFTAIKNAKHLKWKTTPKEVASKYVKVLLNTIEY